MLNTCKSNVVFGELGRRKRGSYPNLSRPASKLQGAGYVDFQPPFAGIGIVENKVANGCVTRGNLPNSSGQILKKAQKRCLMSLRSIR